jgi:predicted O-methyltransferase YrrM
LWPAAEYLAHFVLAVDSSSRESDGTDPSPRSFSSDRKEPVLEVLKELLGPRNTSKVLPIIELGAGVGLTGIELATQLSVKVLLTDLEIDKCPLESVDRNFVAHCDRPLDG